MNCILLIANHTNENHLNENHLTKIPGMGPESLPVDYERTLEDMEYGFKLTDAMYFCKKGMEVCRMFISNIYITD